MARNKRSKKSNRKQSNVVKADPILDKEIDKKADSKEESKSEENIVENSTKSNEENAEEEVSEPINEVRIIGMRRNKSRSNNESAQSTIKTFIMKESKSEENIVENSTNSNNENIEEVVSEPVSEVRVIGMRRNRTRSNNESAQSAENIELTETIDSQDSVDNPYVTDMANLEIPSSIEETSITTLPQEQYSQPSEITTVGNTINQLSNDLTSVKQDVDNVKNDIAHVSDDLSLAIHINDDKINSLLDYYRNLEEYAKNSIQHIHSLRESDIIIYKNNRYDIDRKITEESFARKQSDDLLEGAVRSLSSSLTSLDEGNSLYKSNHEMEHNEINSKIIDLRESIDDIDMSGTNKRIDDNEKAIDKFNRYMVDYCDSILRGITLLGVSFSSLTLFVIFAIAAIFSPIVLKVIFSLFAIGCFALVVFEARNILKRMSEANKAFMDTFSDILGNRSED